MININVGTKCNNTCIHYEVCSKQGTYAKALEKLKKTFSESLEFYNAEFVDVCIKCCYYCKSACVIR